MYLYTCIFIYFRINISQLLKKLKVTKQSLNRVLKDLAKLEIIIEEHSIVNLFFWNYTIFFRIVKY